MFSFIKINSGNITLSVTLIFFINLIDVTKSVVLSNCVCGASNNAYKSRIFGGKDTIPHEYPWVAGIFDKNDEIFCGGSIISSRHILTAGHCVYYVNALTMHTILGLHDRSSSTGIYYNFTQVHLNSKFTPYKYHDSNDIAILEVDRPIQFSNTILPICLPKAPFVKYDLVKAIVAGWGRMWSGGQNSQYLQETKVIIEPTDRCVRTEIGEMVEGDSMICAYAKHADACQGDSGGPLFVDTGYNRFEQFGVTSFGVGCGTENTPGVYTRVTKFLPWILRVISTADTCHDPSASDNN